jgi:thioredoxin 1
MPAAHDNHTWGMTMRVFCSVFVSIVLVCGAAAQAFSAPAVPVQGSVTMVDLGAKACIPCKMMIPVMEWAQKEYAGKAAVVFIDVWENPEQRQLFGVRVIPTQIFYDRNGNEVSRHEGFLDRKPLAETLDKLLAQ